VSALDDVLVLLSINGDGKQHALANAAVEEVAALRAEVERLRERVTGYECAAETRYAVTREET